MEYEIFSPVFNMFCLTTAVFLLVTLLRLKSIYIDKVSPGEDYRHPTFPQGNIILLNAQRNLINLFEFPIFFYATIAIIIATNNIDQTFVDLACYFFYFRLAHSIYHIFGNHIILGGFPLRAPLFLGAFLINAYMIIRLCGML
jgi:hypothetical protein|tara:strand:+ start:1254 stop:1682 length:429 start_codon:yes stop_codon:yes gene_type:complete